MQDKKYVELYRCHWTQEYQSGHTYQPIKKPEIEPELEMDLTQARAVLARIMAL